MMACESEFGFLAEKPIRNFPCKQHPEMREVMAVL